MNRQFLSLSNLTVTHLKQVTSKLPTLKEQELVKLDQAVNSYLLKRKQLKNIHSTQEDSFESQIRSQLLQFQQKNNFLMKQLDIMHKQYCNQRADLQKCNQNCRKDIETAQQFQDSNPYEDLIHQLIQELVPYKKIQEYVVKLQTLKREAFNREIVASNSQEYFQKIDQILAEDVCQQSQLTYYHSDFYS